MITASGSLHFLLYTCLELFQGCEGLEVFKCDTFEPCLLFKGFLGPECWGEPCSRHCAIIFVEPVLYVAPVCGNRGTPLPLAAHLAAHFAPELVRDRLGESADISLSQASSCSNEI